MPPCSADTERARHAYAERLRQLAGARLLLPLTVGVPGVNAGWGQMLLVTRLDQGYAARFVSLVGIFHCTGARSEDGDARLAQAYARAGMDTVRTVRCDAHPSDAGCWLHAPQVCLSTLAVPEDAPIAPAGID